MIISIIGSSSINRIAKILGKSEDEIKQMIGEVAKIVAESGSWILAVPEGAQKVFIQKYKEFGGKKAIALIPEGDKKWGFGWLEENICDEKMNCGTWIDLPYFIMSNCDLVIQMAFGAGTISELVFLNYPWEDRPKPKVLSIKDFLRNGKLPEEFGFGKKDIDYISIKELKKKLKELC